MGRSISILAYSRPWLLGSQLQALLSCQDLVKFDHLMIFVDHGHELSGDCVEEAHKYSDLIGSSGVIEVSVIQQTQNLGVGAHPLFALETALSVGQYDMHVMLEDDALPKPDLLRIMLWWEANYGRYSDSVLFAGCNHRDFGKGQQQSIPEDDPKIVAESVHIPSPFCWCTVKEYFPFLREWWNFKKVPPLGFDYSLSMAMRLYRKVAMHPILSRCQNVGREGGTHESEETFDLTQLGLRYQESEYHGDYELMAMVDRKDLSTYDNWMVPELGRLEKLTK